LLAALDAAGVRGEPPALTSRQDELKQAFEENRGYWNPFWDGVLELDPDFFAAYLQYSSIPWRQGVLEPKVKELIYIAFDAAATHMFVPGLKLHIENAIGLGATAAEIMEVFELASVLGINTLTTGVPILLEELERAKREAP
jgi:alkylhydroperoxidase/carboxymuconolactone decarboxylase family protein YurZ